jgi:hypothetical protein
MPVMKRIVTAVVAHLVNALPVLMLVTIGLGFDVGNAWNVALLLCSWKALR